ncbi:hypothetical protein HC248_00010 [Polaromonas vacuolata]|jgi:hypothetical protein|uniref:Alpha/beta hydrolase n=1 Tax=Polaromonas vacuolata TaxID=37448 RepID=A0A6H2H4G4_9BURK|nr:alpha/beta fold hydrolase [Polaromonas vacuolata]QJC54748.1 hypothetical protein HC248_00010 [Polaromonas vacuolata]
MTTHVLILPGWQNSGPSHWQSLWEKSLGYTRVEQHDWIKPLRGDWIARLEETLLDLPEQDNAVLVAHSLGCIQVAAWAAHSINTQRVKAALLVAPADVEREDMRQILPSWAPIARQRLGFKSLVYASSNDTYCSLERSTSFAKDWGATLLLAGERGHLNGQSNLGDWPEAQAQLQRLMNQA